LPANDEIEAELRDYLALYQAEEHPERITELRGLALEAMQELRAFQPLSHRAGIAGLAGAYAEIDLQLFPRKQQGSGVVSARSQHPLRGQRREALHGRPRRAR
jgi:hypothetical protein